MRFWMPAAALMIAGCTPSEKSEVENAVRDRMRDPGSAVFGPMTPGKSGVVCGMVNGRNGFGGYSGMTPFFYVRETGRLSMSDLSGDWRDKGEEATRFQAQGCSIGADHAQALEVHRLLNQ